MVSRMCHWRLFRANVRVCPLGAAVIPSRRDSGVAAASGFRYRDAGLMARVFQVVRYEDEFEAIS